MDDLRIFAIDTETTALPAARDRIVQFSVRILGRDLEARLSWTELVRPGVRIPAHATAIHGITDALVANAPPFDAFAPRLRSLLEESHVFMAYHHRFDHAVLDRELRRAGLDGVPRHLRFLDPLLIERRVNRRSLGETYRRYTGRDLAGAHRADADADAMVEVLRRQREAHADRLPADLESLLEPRRDAVDAAGRFYRDSEGTVRFGFGRHRDRPVREAPHYLRWMARSFFDAEARAWARRLLSEAAPLNA